MRVTSPAVTIKAIWDALVADYGIAGSYGLLVETNLDEKVSVVDAVADAIKTKVDLNLDGKVSLAKADLTTLETRLSAARAAYLDASIASRLPTASYTPERGTDGAALASAWTAALATILGNFTAARIGYLDNINLPLKDLLYNQFAALLDDYPDITVTGTVSDYAELLDNNLGTSPIFDTVDEYVEVEFTQTAFIKELRVRGHHFSDGSGRFKLQGYIDGSWTDVLTGIPNPSEDEWSNWLTLTTPSSSLKWRFVCTTVDAGSSAMKELELKGYTFG